MKRKSIIAIGHCLGDLLIIAINTHIGVLIPPAGKRR